MSTANCRHLVSEDTHPPIVPQPLTALKPSTLFTFGQSNAPCMLTIEIVVTPRERKFGWAGFGHF